MMHQGEPRTICLTCGTISPGNVTSCSECNNTGKKPIFLPFVHLEEPQTCGICGEKAFGGIVEEKLCDKYLSKLIDLRIFSSGNFCGNCGAYYCIKEKLPKQSFWSGLKNAICPRCNGRVSPLGGKLMIFKPDVIAARKRKELAEKVYWHLYSGKYFEAGELRNKLLLQLEEVGPELIDYIFTTTGSNLFMLLKIAEIGATQLLINEQVEKRLIDLPHFDYISELDQVIQLERATRSGILIPLLIKDLLNRNIIVGSRAKIAESLGEITWDPRVVEGLKLALNDTEECLNWGIFGFLITEMSISVAQIASRSIRKIEESQKSTL